MKLSCHAPLALAVLLLGTGVGCADPQGAYDDFLAREKADQQATSSSAASSSSSGTGGSGGGSCVPMAGEADGEYFVALVANIAAPKPLLLDAQLTTADKGGSLELTLVVQALDAHAPTKRLGQKITFPAAKVASNGAMVIQGGDLVIEGNADPLLYGTEIDTSGIVLDGTFCAPAKFVCGALHGMITMPIPDDLDKAPGSTWTMVPWDGKTVPSKIYADCAMNEATLTH